MPTRNYLLSSSSSICNLKPYDSHGKVTDKQTMNEVIFQNEYTRAYSDLTEISIFYYF